MNDLIYEWNSKAPAIQIELCDETLRDGLQSPSVQEPCIDSQCQILSLMDKLGIFIADIGLPGAGERASQNTKLLAQHIAKQKLHLKAYCAGRTLEADIKPIAEVQEASGIPIAAYCFLGTSPIRQAVEDWNLDQLLKTSEKAILFAHQNNLEVAFVTEDTTRSHPDTLEKLFKQAVNMGVKRLVLCDTVGHSTPEGVRNLVSWTKNLLGPEIALDWHGHNDRGLGLINSIAAAYAGCTRIHGTGLGIGERVGNTAMDQLIVNFKLLGLHPANASQLNQYVELVSKACKVPIPDNYPVFGADAFRTATGVHAAAVIKAQNKHKPDWADLVYSGVPARYFGKEQIIEIGPMSGLSNIKHWLQTHDIDLDTRKLEQAAEKILLKAKQSTRVLTSHEIYECLN